MSTREELTRQAEKALRQGRVDEALAHYQELAVLEPVDWGLVKQFADLLERANQREAAAQQFGRWADHLFVEGFHSKAAALYKKVLKLEPADEHALWQLAEVSLELKLKADARVAFQRVAEIRQRRGDAAGALAARERLSAIETAASGPSAAPARPPAYAAPSAPLSGPTEDASGAPLAASPFVRNARPGVWAAGPPPPVESAPAAPPPETPEARLARLRREAEAADVAHAPDADQRWQEVLDADPQDVATRLRLVQAAMDCGDLAAAERLGASLDATEGPALTALVELAFRQARPDALQRLVAGRVHAGAPPDHVLAPCALLAPRHPGAARAVLTAAAAAWTAAGQPGHAALALEHGESLGLLTTAMHLQWVEICVDAGLPDLSRAQRALAGAYVAEQRFAEARAVAEDLFVREAGEEPHRALLLDILDRQGHADPHRVLVDLLTPPSDSVDDTDVMFAPAPSSDATPASVPSALDDYGYLPPLHVPQAERASGFLDTGDSSIAMLDVDALLRDDVVAPAVVSREVPARVEPSYLAAVAPTPDAGVEDASGVGGEYAPGPGSEHAPGPGGEHAPGVGGAHVPSAGGEYVPDVRGEHVPGVGVELQLDAPAGGDEGARVPDETIPAEQTWDVSVDQASLTGVEHLSAAGHDPAPFPSGDVQRDAPAPPADAGLGSAFDWASILGRDVDDAGVPAPAPVEATIDSRVAEPPSPSPVAPQIAAVSLPPPQPPTQAAQAPAPVSPPSAPVAPEIPPAPPAVREVDASPFARLSELQPALDDEAPLQPSFAMPSTWLSDTTDAPERPRDRDQEDDYLFAEELPARWERSRLGIPSPALHRVHEGDPTPEVPRAEAPREAGHPDGDRQDLTAGSTLVPAEPPVVAAPMPEVDASTGDDDAVEETDALEQVDEPAPVVVPLVEEEIDLTQLLEELRQFDTVLPDPAPRPADAREPVRPALPLVFPDRGAPLAEDAQPDDPLLPEPAPPSPHEGTTELDAVFDDLHRHADDRGVAEQQLAAGRVFLAAGLASEAARAFERASLEPRSRFAATLTLAELHKSRGQLLEAVSWYEQAAMAPVPDAAVKRPVLYDLAESLEALGETDRALGVLLDLLSQVEDYRDARARLDRLLRVDAGG